MSDIKQFFGWGSGGVSGMPPVKKIHPWSRWGGNSNGAFPLMSETTGRFFQSTRSTEGYLGTLTFKTAASADIWTKNVTDFGAGYRSISAIYVDTVEGNLYCVVLTNTSACAFAKIAIATGAITVINANIGALATDFCSVFLERATPGAGNFTLYSSVNTVAGKYTITPAGVVTGPVATPASNGVDYSYGNRSSYVSADGRIIFDYVARGVANNGTSSFAISPTISVAGRLDGARFDTEISAVMANTPVSSNSLTSGGWAQASLMLLDPTTVMFTPIGYGSQNVSVNKCAYARADIDAWLLAIAQTSLGV